MCLASVLALSDLKVIVGQREIYYAKEILNYFECVEVRILVGK
jgi:hypothetical protein